MAIEDVPLLIHVAAPKAEASSGVNNDAFHDLMTEAIAKKWSIKPIKSTTEQTPEELVMNALRYFEADRIEETKKELIERLTLLRRDNGLNNTGYIRFRKLSAKASKALSERGKELAEGNGKSKTKK